VVARSASGRTCSGGIVKIAVGLDALGEAVERVLEVALESPRGWRRRAASLARVRLEALGPRDSAASTSERPSVRWPRSHQ
jgi:hypothetical protein